MNRSIGIGVAALSLAVAAALGGYALYRSAPGATRSEPTVVSTGPYSASAPSVPASQIQHPLQLPAGLPPLPAENKTEAYVEDRLIDLLGRQAVLSMVNTSHFVANFVATVDNLPRESASSMVWPVKPAPERFLVEQVDGASVISPKNADRYAPMVNLLETLDANSAVALYRHLYPLFQQAYESLGYPGKYFNDRLVAVIDHLLQTPEPAGPIRLTLTEVKGPVPSTRPWVRYQFAEANLEACSAGQKLLMRMGLAQERRVKTRLAEFRQQLVLGGQSTR